jgi:GntR family transcriptional repressor for pyruvate dehydrogenase complex
MEGASVKAEQAVKVFEPIEHDSVADAVVDQIEGLIVSGVLKEGRKLPAEREMAEAMGVSRPKLREALKRLEDAGLVLVRHGEGSFIAPLIGKALSPALIALFARRKSALFDHLEYRRRQEGFAASLAAQRATALDRERLTELMDRLQDAHGKGDRTASQIADLEFHVAIVDASHNATLIHMMASIYELTMQGVLFNRDMLRAVDGASDKLLAQHLTIGRAIQRGDAADAETSAMAHIDYVSEALRTCHEIEERDRVAMKMKLFREDG